MSRGFGRDEMNALIGGRSQGGSESLQDTAGLRQSQHHQQHNSRTVTNNNNKEIDISKLTSAETAAFLATGKQNRKLTSGTSRYRTKDKVLAHHELLAEELSSGQFVINGVDDDNDNNNKSDDDSSDEEFLRKRRLARAPVVVSRSDRYRDDGKNNRHRRRRRSCDSYSSSSEDSTNSGRRNQAATGSRRRLGKRGDCDASSSSSSDDEEEIERRRHRRSLAARKVQNEEPETIIPNFKQSKNTGSIRQESTENRQSKETVRELMSTMETSQTEGKELNSAAVGVKSKPIDAYSSSSDDGNRNGNSSFAFKSSQNSLNSSRGSSSSSSSSSSDSDSSSSEDEGHVRVKPVFVPKHRRNLIQTEEKKWKEEEMRLEREQEQNKKRKLESRSLVAKQMAAAEASSLTGEEDDFDDEARGATNSPPNDDDEVDPETEYEAWELREIERLLKHMEQLMKQKEEEEYYNRRKKLTDSECLREDMESGSYQQPGMNRKSNKEANHLQRFYHRGGFYMDESEWDEDDIRGKAGEYAMAATGDDKIDKSKKHKYSF